MKSALFRSSIAGIASLLLWAAAQVAANVFMCPEGQVWARVHSGASTVVMDRGEQIARPGDTIFTCDTPHTMGSLVLHHDLACYCAPGEASAIQVSERLGGLCAVDTLQPAPDDAGSACRFGRCAGFVDPSMGKGFDGSRNGATGESPRP